jgi:hypothetical protein
VNSRVYAFSKKSSEKNKGDSPIWTISFEEFRIYAKSDEE